MGQFRALFVKNWILYKRSWIGNLLEILIPVIFVVFVIMIRRLATTTDQPEKQYVGTSNPLSISIPYNSVLYKNCNNLAKRGGKIALVPSGDPIVTLLASTFTSNGFSVAQFNSDSEVDALVRNQLYGVDSSHPSLCFGITIDSSNSPNYKYKLRFNVSVRDSEGPYPATLPTIEAPFNSKTISEPASSGMLTVNNLLLNIIMNLEATGTETFNQVVAPMKQEAYFSDPIYSYLGNSMDMLCLLPLLIIYLRQTSTMLSEKEKKIRETMKIMGMQGFNYYITWFIRYLAVYITVHVICTIILARSFNYINAGVIFITFILFDIVLILQSFFIQIFFTRAKIGMVIALLFFIIQYVISFIIKNSDQPSITQGALGSISPHSAFVSAFSSMLYAQSVQNTVGFSNIRDNINNYAIGISWASFIIHAIFWTVLTIYLEQVFPNEWGAKRHPLFCLEWIWKRRSSDRADGFEISQGMSTPNTENVEAVDQRLKDLETRNQVIRIQNLNKQFDNGRKAVKDLNLNIYNDQIFVLLGHNGAGKTTTISMLSGLLEPSSGKVDILGYDLATELEEIRKTMGVCPQHDTLYDDLTVEEHLYLFGTFKGYQAELLDQEVKKLIKAVNLEEKTEYYSKDLSGGQKRRLSVAMAFIGGSKLIFLDEPTSGMDTSARRYIWEMMKDYKSDRIIILTTHFMDEADFLGDRIAIMSDGKLVCAGSSIFLKNKFGVGYNITLVKKDTTVDANPIINLIQSHIPKALVQTNVSAEVGLQLPMDDVNKFPKMFEQLDSKKDKLGIQGYGVSITTLEEVFLKVAEVRHDEKEEEVDASDSMAQLGQLTERVPVYEVDEHEGRFFRHCKATLVKRFLVSVRDLKTMSFEFIFPIVIILLAMFLMRISFITDTASQTFDTSIFKSEGLPLQIPVSGSAAYTSSFVTQLNTDFANKVTGTYYSTSGVQDFDANTVYPKKTKYLKGAFYLDTGNNATDYKLYTLVNTKSVVTPLLLPTLAAQSLINLVTGKSISISVTSAPFPRTYQNLQINNTISGFLGAFIFSIALAFKFSSVIAFIVKEREDKCKHQQIVSGMNIASYWLANYLFDMIFYILVAIFAAAMCKAFSLSSLVDGDAYAATWLLFVLLGLANIPFTYMASYIFNDYGNSQAGWYFWNFVLGGLAPVIILVLRFIGSDTSVVARGIAWPLRIIPAYCFGDGLINVGSMTLLTISEKGSLTNKYKVFDSEIALANIIFLAIETLVYMSLIFVIEALSNSENFMRFFTRESAVVSKPAETDEDVLAEIEIARRADPTEYTILTKDLRKVYMLGEGKHKVAVDSLSFTVTKGDVFGLLGVNGAGKTTTFKMLAGEVTSTSGDAYFNGMKISDNLSKVRKSLGYCPQFDALLENLTVREQLELYYDMKGLPSELRNLLIDIKIQELNLAKYRNVLSGTLSGGNKRKLSVACALIGDPSIVFLDEPSTGMDPEARRFMWKVISSISTEKKQSTVILTTHSMEEAEALSTRLGIMVKGNFRCLGTPQHIKSKYGEGYELEIKILLPTKTQIESKLKQVNIAQDAKVTKERLSQVTDKLTTNQYIKGQISMQGSGKFMLTQLKQSGSTINIATLVEFVMIQERGLVLQDFLTRNLGEVSVIEHFQAFFRYKLKTNTAIGKIFGAFQENQKSLWIQQYSIKQATVEQIFNRFAEQYEEEQQ